MTHVDPDSLRPHLIQTFAPTVVPDAPSAGSVVDYSVYTANVGPSLIAQASKASEAAKTATSAGQPVLGRSGEFGLVMGVVGLVVGGLAVL